MKDKNINELLQLLLIFWLEKGPFGGLCLAAGRINSHKDISYWIALEQPSD